MLTTSCRPVFVGILALLMPAMAAAKDYTVTISAPNRSYRDTPVTVSVPAPGNFAGVAVMIGKVPVPSQSRLNGKSADVTWLISELKKGGSIKYTLSFERVSRPVPVSGVIIDKNGANLDVRINNELFTTYNTTTGPNKPYFYPMFAPGHKRIVRGYPIEKIAGENSNDHPHHRGLWFTHGEVNGEDYWAEGPKSAKTVNKGYGPVVSGPVYGSFEARTDWINLNGVKIAEDVRDVTIYNFPDGRLMDFSITFTPAGDPVEFGDTKEGMFGLRIPDSMRVTGGDGRIVMSTGLSEPVEETGKRKAGGTWGKRAAWVDYYGTTDGAVMGVAILDHPQNLRHPTYWHVRDYGLFCANPFGIHDFVRGEPKDAGSLKVERNKPLSFKYRVFIHKGSTDEANVADVWAAYSDPPKVELR